VNVALAAVADETPLEKSLACDHCTVYGVAARPEPPSVEAVQVQVGVVSVVGVVVLGVPGTLGVVSSITTLPAGEKADSLPRASTALTLKYQVPSASALKCV
jgi:hypothetical protein